MKKNEMRMLSNFTSNIGGTDYKCIVEQIKNSTYGTPRYEVIVITPTYGTYKVREEGYYAQNIIAARAVKKVLEKLSDIK